MKEITVCRLMDVAFIVFFIVGAAVAGLNWYMVEHSAMNAILHVILQLVSIGLIAMNLYAIWKFYIKKYLISK